MFQPKSYYENYYAHFELPQDVLTTHKQLAIFQPVIQMLTSSKMQDWAIADLGCGAGLFAEYAAINGFTKYTGFDYSENAIKSAKERVPGATFIIQDLSTLVFTGKYEKTVFTIIETLEHLENRRQLISRLPHGAMVIVSVPTFNCPSHTVSYPNLSSFFHEFDDLLTIDYSTFIFPFWHLIFSQR